MLLIVCLILGGACLAPLLVRALGTRAFLVLALLPAAGFGWALLQTGRVRRGEGPTETISWIPSLHMELAFRADTLSWLMTLLVTGIGALVLVYCRWYFSDDSEGLGRFAATLTAFAGAMLGLVLSDDMLLLYVFWELTTVLSYLLVGHYVERKSARRAAMQALVVTTLGGLAMLVGMIMLGEQTGTYRVSEVVEAAPRGVLTGVAVVLILAGAITKSALVPFHFWLPGAMAAPTPVSAYLHAAAMVKAGIFLVARFAPGLAGSGAWRPTVLILGGATLLIGGWVALRQTDLKLLLAYGTVSQLGFLTMLVGAGTRASAMAGLTMVLAHALFKACLFLIVGIIDKISGTRDIRELSGLGRAHPVLAGAAIVAAASMAGLPPTLGFVAKEAALTGFVPGSGSDALLLGISAAGAALTFAYSGRLIWGAFADKPGAARTVTSRAGRGICAGPVALAALSLAGGLLAGPLDRYIAPYARTLPELGGAHDEIEHLALWHGFTPALLLTALIVVAGSVLVAGRESVEWLQERTQTGLDAQRTYRSIMRGVDRVAVEVTGATQRGSQPLYLGIILVTAVVILAITTAAAFAGGLWPDNLILWDTPAQGVVGALTVAGAVLAARSRRRLRAVILVGVTGYGTAMLFLLGGAPDLALTQVLVETITLVVFVLVLRRLPPFFSDRPLAASRWIRLAIGLAVGGGVSLVALLAVGAREAEPVSTAFPAEAVEYGGGKNIVNVTLVDIRAWDTMGEISVLVVAATGVASLTFLSRTMTRRVRVVPESAPAHDTHPGRSSWLATSAILDPARRSVIFEVVTRLIFHTIMLFSLYLLFSGHNHPGGGFAGGLVAGLALTVRYLAGGRYELNEAAPIDAGVLLGLGLFVATGSGLAPFAFGGTVLQSAILDAHLPIFGEVHLVTSAIFDIGVYLVVIGLVLDILRSLGAEIDRQIEDAGSPGLDKQPRLDAAAVAR